MRVAILLSGRITRYELCLLPILNKKDYNYQVDLFIAVNDTDWEYYNDVREACKPYLKGLYIKPYIFPEEFECDFKGNDGRYAYQLINNKWLPRNQLSMYFNDKKAFEMACEYEKENNFEYDYFMRFRADLFNTSLPKLKEIEKDEPIFFSVQHPCDFQTFGIYKTKPVSSDWVWGNKKAMEIYCSTYEYVLEENRKNKIIFHFESNHTDRIISSNMPIQFIIHYYNIDTNRKIYDDNWEKTTEGIVKDSRGVPPPKFIGVQKREEYKSHSEIEKIAD
jgi:hypothetical protein